MNQRTRFGSPIFETTISEWVSGESLSFLHSTRDALASIDPLGLGATRKCPAETGRPSHHHYPAYLHTPLRRLVGSHLVRFQRTKLSLRSPATTYPVAGWPIARRHSGSLVG